MKHKINREIYKLENRYPEDQLISSYTDFKKHRAALPYCQYNPKVMQSLIDLTYELWDSDQKINRFSLLEKAHTYFKKAPDRADIPLDSRRKIFRLFQKIVVLEGYPSENERRRKEAAELINGLLREVPLTTEEEQWLCQYALLNTHVLNRVLRYPKPSSVITHWAKDHYTNLFAARRRAEFTGWLLDENPDFTITEEQLLEDFRRVFVADSWQLAMTTLPLLNTTPPLDEPEFIPPTPFIYDEDPLWKEVSEWEEVVPMHKPVEEEPLPVPFYEDEDEVYRRPVFPKLPRRTFDYVLYSIEQLRHLKVSHIDLEWPDIPDFNQTKKKFILELKDHYNRTNIWSIAYSRLEIVEKCQLLTKWYDQQYQALFLYIGKKLGSIEYYQWLKEVVK